MSDPTEQDGPMPLCMSPESFRAAVDRAKRLERELEETRENVATLKRQVAEAERECTRHRRERAAELNRDSTIISELLDDCKRLKTAIAERDARLSRAEAERAAVEDALRRFVDHETDPCRFDHHGHCQEHPGAQSAGQSCAIADGRALLAAAQPVARGPDDEVWLGGGTLGDLKRHEAAAAPGVARGLERDGAGPKRPEYEPKTPEQKIGYLIEECGEVLAAAGKTVRWGPQSYNPELPPEERETNEAWLLREVLDLDVAVGLVRELLGKPRGAPLRDAPVREPTELPEPWSRDGEYLVDNDDHALSLSPDCACIFLDTGSGQVFALPLVCIDALRSTPAPVREPRDETTEPAQWTCYPHHEHTCASMTSSEGDCTCGAALQWEWEHRGLVPQADYAPAQRPTPGVDPRLRDAVEWAQKQFAGIRSYLDERAKEARERALFSDALTGEREMSRVLASAAPPAEPPEEPAPVNNLRRALHVERNALLDLADHDKPHDARRLGQLDDALHHLDCVEMALNATPPPDGMPGEPDWDALLAHVAPDDDHHEWSWKFDDAAGFWYADDLLDGFVICCAVEITARSQAESAGAHLDRVKWPKVAALVDLRATFTRPPGAAPGPECDPGEDDDDAPDGFNDDRPDDQHDCTYCGGAPGLHFNTCPTRGDLQAFSPPAAPPVDGPPPNVDKVFATALRKSIDIIATGLDEAAVRADERAKTERDIAAKLRRDASMGHLIERATRDNCARMVERSDYPRLPPATGEGEG